MAQIEATGGSVSYTPDGKKLTKKAYVLTGGTTSVTPETGFGELVSAEFQDDVAETRRVVLTYQQGVEVGSTGAVIAAAGAVQELTGGCREVPVKTHFYFQYLTRDELAEIDRAFAASNKDEQALDPSKIDASRLDSAQTLLGLLQRGVEYYLVPSVVYRETTLESQKPTLEAISKIDAPVNAPNAAPANWLLTAINYQTVQRPTGGTVYQVTREWTLSGNGGWHANNTGDFKLYYES